MRSDPDGYRIVDTHSAGLTKGSGLLKPFDNLIQEKATIPPLLPIDTGEYSVSHLEAMALVFAASFLPVLATMTGVTVLLVCT